MMWINIKFAWEKIAVDPNVVDRGLKENVLKYKSI